MTVWTTTDDRRLLALWPDHEVAEIATELGYSSVQVRSHVSYLRRTNAKAAAVLTRKKTGPKQGFAEVTPDKRNFAPAYVIDDGYPDVPWHMRISTRDQRLGAVR